jgi:hypothetical protein
METAARRTEERVGKQGCRISEFGTKQSRLDKYND